MKDRREQHRQDMAVARASARDLAIPSVKDPARRAQLGEDDAAWLRFYLPDVFYNPFTDDQQAIIDECGATLRYGTQKCKAAPRGDGKSSIIKYLMLKYALYRQVRFPLCIAATFGKAQKTTDAIKSRLSSKADSLLAEDFPLECHVARYVHPWPSRARNVTATEYARVTRKGKGVGNPVGEQMRSVHLEWGSRDGYFILPTWESDEPLGPILMSIGWSSDELQGCNVLDVRPDFVMIDDLDSRDSLAAEHGTVSGKIEECIDKTIAGMGGQSRRLGQFMICTITSEAAAAYRYSDPKIKPGWDGERVAAIRKWPDRMDLWDKYVTLWQAAPHEGDQFHRTAHQFYLDNREEMDAGAVVSNEHNYDRNELPDGSSKEVSNLQRCFNAIAKTSREAFDTEYQNDPPKRADVLETKVTSWHVADCAGELGRGTLDPTTTMVCRGVDVRKIELHQVAVSSEHAINHRIPDYGITTHGNSETTVEQAEEAILEALRRMAADWDENPLTDLNGMAHGTDLCLVDKGWLGNWTEDGVQKTWASQPVETFCMEQGLRQFLPAKGAPNYRSPKPSRGVIIGDNWHINRGEGAERSCDEVIWNAAHWHLLVEELFMIEDGADRFELFAPSDGIYANHKAFAEHIVVGAKQLKEQLSRGTRSRKPRFVRDHWWDSLAMALVAKSIETAIREKQRTRKKKLSLADMQKAAQ